MRTVEMNAKSAPRTGPDFRHVGAWIFDLDNTLYPADSDLFVQVDARMTAFVQDLLGLDFESARAVQKAYYRDHGTTLNGLMKINGIDPEDFLASVHDVDLSVLEPNPALASALALLPGKRFIFTNGCRNHAERVLTRLRLGSLFDEIWDIRTIGYRPKPDERSYRAVLAKSGVATEKSAMFEDVARNLVPAHALGWTTVWLRNGSAWSKQGPEYPIIEPEHIHHVIENLPQFLHSIRI
jgi:putative hydrolase of the HAD superfamily